MTIIYHCYQLKGTEEELNEMKMIMDEDWITHPSFNKYFIAWSEPELGNFYFPKEVFFVAREYNNVWETNYFAALEKYDRNFLRRLLKGYSEQYLTNEN